MSYNTSSAYKLPDFEKPSEKKADINKLKIIKNRKPIHTPILNPGAISAFLIVVTLIILMVYNNVQLAELTEDINDLSAEIQMLESENVRLTSAVESSMKSETIAEMAKALGMQKRDEFQTELIYLYKEDKIERTDAAPKETSAATSRLTISAFWGRFKEYLKAG